MSFIEELLVVASKYVVGNNELLLAQTRWNIQSITPSDVGSLGSLTVDVFEAAVFIKLLFSVKYTIFSTDTGLQTILNNNTPHFKEIYPETENVTI